MKETKKRDGKKGKIALVIVFFVVALLPRAALSKVYLTREEALRTAFPQADKISRKIIRLNEEQKKRIAQKSSQSINFSYKSVYIAEKNGDRLGYAIIDQVKGKSKFIKYLVAIDPEGTIKGIEILTYSETQGAEIRHKSFRKQFIGKKGNDPLRLGIDIDTITGATISCRSITDGVRKIMSFWEEIFGSSEK